MGTEVKTLQPIAHPTPQTARLLSPQELQEHRSQIAFEVRTHIRWFERDERIIAGRLSWWCDELQDWTVEQVVWALRKWNREEPDKEPTPGHIVRILKAMRGKAEVRRAAQSKPPEAQPERRRVTAEQAAAILKEANFKVKRFGPDQDNKTEEQS